MKKLIGLILFSLSLTISAAMVDGINFPDSVKVEGKELHLNGVGIRKATFLKVKVYYGGLYLEQKAKDPGVFLNTPAPKQIVMHFVRDVDAKKLREAFNEGMEAANINHTNFKAQMEKFNSFVDDVVKNDEFVISFLSDGVLFSSTKRKTNEKVAGADFSRALLSIWFNNARDEGLRSGLLGL